MAIPDKQATVSFHAQEALTQNETLFRALIENGSDIIVLVTAEGLVSYVSPSITHILGYPPEDMIGRHALMLIHPDDLSLMEKVLADVFQSPRKSLRAEYRLRHRNGSWLWFEGFGTNLLDDPQVGAIVGNFRDITERKQAVDALQEEEQRFHMVWESASDAMALSDTKGRILAVNSAYYRLYGFKPEDVIGNTFAIIFPQEQQEWAAAQYQSFFEGEKRDASLETTIRRADGGVRIVETSYDFLVQHGRRVAMISIIRDITERKQAQEQLKASEERFRVLLERSADAITLLDREGKHLYSTPAATRILGYEPTEYVGEKMLGYVHPDDVQQVQLVFAAILQQPGESLSAKLRVQHKNRSWVWIEGTSTNMLKNPAVGAIVVNYSDVTEHKQLEEAIRQSRQQLDVILQNIADGISVQDTQRTVVYINDAGARFRGYSSAAEALRTPDFQTRLTSTLQSFEIRDEQGNPFLPAELPGGRALRGETHPQAIVQYYDRISKTRRWALVRAQPIFGEDGQVQLAVTILSDITEAYESEKRKDEFIGIASHELKTPITTIKGLTQLVKRRLEKQGGTELTSIIASIETQINRLTKLVNDLLDVSKIQAGRLDYAQEPMAIDELVQTIVDTALLTSTTHTITVQGASHRYILGDRDRLEQVFLNLIGNAMKYSPQADTVAIRITTSHDMVIISVQDDGVGISPEHHSQIFNRFYRVDDEKTKDFPGLGMGLHISWEIINRHGGTITVESARGKGSIFSVSLPYQKEEVQ